MDLAHRFAAAAAAASVSVLALKGVSIVDELYGGPENRPMADIDFLVIDTPNFPRAIEVARSLELVEVGASDHALVFKEGSSGVILELHVSLTACPGLFPIDHRALWERRVAVNGTPMFRLSDPDLLIHFALHTAFQHGFVVNDHHFGDFIRLLELQTLRFDQVVAIARGALALEALGAMTVACARRNESSTPMAKLADQVARHTPPRLRRWIESRPAPPLRFSAADLAFVRFQLAPSKWRCLKQTLFPSLIPGRSTRRAGAFQRWRALAEAGWAGAEPRPPSQPQDSLDTRVPTPEVAEQWIRECLALGPAGGTLTVSGTCMEPALMEGTRIQLMATTRDPQTGDVVLIQTPGGLRLHRVVWSRGNTIRTKGDRGHYLDPKGSPEAVIAIQADPEPRFRRLLRAVLSLLRLLGRTWWPGASAGNEGDPAHARLLP